jgi:hypothetical protein
LNFHKFRTLSRIGDSKTSASSVGKMKRHNASLQLLPEAGAQRTLEAVSCKALFGNAFEPIYTSRPDPLRASP